MAKLLAFCYPLQPCNDTGALNCTSLDITSATDICLNPILKAECCGFCQTRVTAGEVYDRYMAGALYCPAAGDVKCIISISFEAIQVSLEAYFCLAFDGYHKKDAPNKTFFN